MLFNFLLVVSQLIVIEEGVLRLAMNNRKLSDKYINCIISLFENHHVLLVGSYKGYLKEFVKNNNLGGGRLFTLQIADDSDFARVAFKNKYSEKLLSSVPFIGSLKHYPIHLLPTIYPLLINNKFAILTSKSNVFNFHSNTIDFINLKYFEFFIKNKDLIIDTLMNRYKTKSTLPVLILDVDDTFCGVGDSKGQYYSRTESLKFITEAQKLFDVYLVSLSAAWAVKLKLEQLNMNGVIDNDHIVGKDTLFCFSYYYLFHYGEPNACFRDPREFFDSTFAKEMEILDIQDYEEFFDILPELGLEYKPIEVIPQIENRILLNKFVIVDDQRNVYHPNYADKMITVPMMKDVKNDATFPNLLNSNFKEMQDKAKVNQ